MGAVIGEPVMAETVLVEPPPGYRYGHYPITAASGIIGGLEVLVCTVCGNVVGDVAQHDATCEKDHPGG